MYVWLSTGNNDHDNSISMDRGGPNFGSVQAVSAGNCLHQALGLGDEDPLILIKKNLSTFEFIE